MPSLNFLTKHLTELRKRLLRCLTLWSIASLALMPFANNLYHFLAKPLLKLLPQHSALIATALPSVFFVPMKLAFFVAFLICLPFFLREAGAFILPALYPKERRWLSLLVFSNALFYTGILFAYVVVLPLLFSFFVQTSPSYIDLMPDVASYFDLVMQLLIVFGFAFQVPIVMWILVSSGAMELKTLVQKRRYFILIAFVVGMFVTPPDVVSQSLFAVPLCLLFEAGLLLAKFMGAPKKMRESDEQKDFISG